MTLRAVFPLPDRDFDPTEVSVPWRALRSAGVEVVFATVAGARASCDPHMLTGVDLGVFGHHLGALPQNVALYRELEQDSGFAAPKRFEEIRATDFDALVLCGGHAKGMRPYLEDEVLRAHIRDFMAQDKVIGAICHGGVALVRSGVAQGRTMTSLPKWMEVSAHLLTGWRVADYYRTYPEYVEDEVRRLIAPGGRYIRGPLSNSYARPFVVEDKNLITARWPGDAAAFAEALVRRLRPR